MPSQLDLRSVCDAGQVRLAQFARAYAALKEQGLPYRRPVQQSLDLRLGLERAAKLPAGPDQDTVLGYLIETYGLLAVATDPFLRASLPPVPASGASVRRRVLGFHGRATGYASHLVGTGAFLVPVS